MKAPSIPVHLKTARGHAGFAAWYGLFALLLLLATPKSATINLPALAMLAAAIAFHVVLACGAIGARPWARRITLLTSYPLLLVIPLGTLAAIQMISYCTPDWSDPTSA